MQAATYIANADMTHLPVGLTAGPGLTLSYLRKLDDCVKLVGTDGRLKFMNETGMRMMGMPDPHSVMGAFWWDLWPEQTRAQLADAVDQASAGNVVQFDADCPTARGVMMHWDVSLTPIVEDDGRVSNLLAISKECAA